jgi:hypothetical protein
MERKLDRIEVPKFFKMKRRGRGAHGDFFGQVFAESNDHFRKGWVTMGLVSKQTPLGQGIFLGFDRKELREATKGEALAALKQNHPHGSEFRPSCREVLDDSFYLAASRASANRLEDGSYPEPIINKSRAGLESFRNAALKRHQELMERWDLVCSDQIRAIRKALSAG